MTTLSNDQQGAGRKPGLDIIANVQAVLAASGYVKSSRSPFTSPYAFFVAQMEERLPESAMAPVAGGDSRALWKEVCSAVAIGAELDVRFVEAQGCPRLRDVDAALAKKRSPRVSAAIEEVVRAVADVLGAGPAGEAFARRWVAYAVEQVRWLAVALDREAE